MSKIIAIGLIAVIGCSAVYAIKAIWKLIRLKKWAIALAFVAFIIGYPFIIKYVVQIQNEHIRLWTAVPAFLVSLVWMFLGFFMTSFTQKIEEQSVNLNCGKPGISSKDRLLGAALMLLGAIIWCYGAFNSDITKSWERILLIASMFCLFFGFHRLTKFLKL